MNYKESDDSEKKNFTYENGEFNCEINEENGSVDGILLLLFDEADPISQHIYIEKIDEILSTEENSISIGALAEFHLCEYILSKLGSTSSFIALPYFHILEILSKNIEMQEIMISHDIIFIINQFISDNLVSNELSRVLINIYINLVSKIAEKKLLYYISFESISKCGADIAALTFFETISGMDAASKLLDQIILFALYSSPVDEKTSCIFANIAFSCVYEKPDNFRYICAHPDIEHSESNLLPQVLKYTDDDNIELVIKVMKIILYGYAVKTPYIIHEMKDRAEWLFDIAITIEDENAVYYSLMAFASMASIDNEAVQSLATPCSISKLLQIGKASSFKTCVSICHALYALLFTSNEDCSIEAIQNGIFEFAASYFDIDSEWTENMAHLIRVVLKPLKDTSSWEWAIEKLEESEFFDNIDSDTMSEKAGAVINAVFNWIYPSKN